MQVLTSVRKETRMSDCLPIGDAVLPRYPIPYAARMSFGDLNEFPETSLFWILKEVTITLLAVVSDPSLAI